MYATHPERSCSSLISSWWAPPAYREPSPPPPARLNATDTEEGFYSFAAITRDPPPEVQDAGHDRCIVALKPENIDVWLEPDPGRLSAMYAILDDPIDAYYQHELPERVDDAPAAIIRRSKFDGR